MKQKPLDKPMEKAPAAKAPDTTVEVVKATDEIAPEPEKSKSDVVAEAIAAVQADPSRPILNVEHLEVQTVERLVEEGHDRAWAEGEVRGRLY